MKLPWKLKEELKEKKEKIEELESQLEELEDEKESWRKRFEAEEERRSRISRKKQEAEEELKKLKEKHEASANEKEETEEDEDGKDLEEINLADAVKILKKLGSVNSPEKELVTVQCPEKLSDFSQNKELRNSVSREKMTQIQGSESFSGFIDPDLGVFVLKSAPFFREDVVVGDSFETSPLLKFVEKEKHWCLVSAGKSVVYREKNGEYEEVESVKNRVDNEHSKGGFSQGRFERKRDEQVSQHLEQTERLLEDYEEVFILGEKKHCEELPGKYLGNFDPNQKKPEQFYRFRFGAFF